MIFQLYSGAKAIHIPYFRFWIFVFSQASYMQYDILLKCWEAAVSSQSYILFNEVGKIHVETKMIL